MDKYLKQLLEAYAKVILPSFGAIVVENEETGNLMFNEYLSYNDGKLDNLIMSESNMELQEAQNMIAKYIRDIQVELDKGESYDIFELGRFFKNEDGDIEFEGNLKSGPKKQSAPKKAAASKTAESEKKKEEAPKKEEKVDTKATKDVKSEAKPTPKENKFVAKKEKEESKAANEKSKAAANNKKEEAKANKAKLKAEAKKKKEEAKANKAKLKAEAKKKKAEEKANKARLKAEAKKKKAEAKKGAKSSEKTKAPEKTEKVADKAKASASPKVEKVKNEKTSKDPKAPKKKKRFGAIFWVVIVILALVSAGLIYVGLNYEQVKTYMGWNKFKEETVTPKESKEASEETENVQEDIEFDANGNTTSDSTEASNVEIDEEGNIAEGKQEVEEKPAPKPKPSPVTTNTNGTHHLIAGSFSNKSNAEGLVEDLKSKGLNARILGQFGGLHFVAAESYNSSKEAQADLSRVRQKAEGAWIFKYNDN